MAGTILVTGGAGYVGSHCCKAFAQAGWRVVTVDNLSRGWREAVKWGPLHEADIGDRAAMARLLEAEQPDLVAHFAAYAYVGESVTEPELYYRNNSAGTLALLSAMRDTGIGRLVFSSTCATYGHPESVPILESQPQRPINPYGWSKLFVERMLADYAAAYGFNSIALRYFNAAGCDPDGEIGEHHVPETHAIPLAIAAALDGGTFTVNGTDFPTRDGSAVRDYIHVGDLADAHVRAADRLMTGARGAEAFNLGTGRGVTVREVVGAVEAATGCTMRVLEGPRRPGDPAELVASPQRAMDTLGWQPRLSGLDSIVETATAWERARRASAT